MFPAWTAQGEAGPGTAGLLARAGRSPGAGTGGFHRCCRSGPRWRAARRRRCNPLARPTSWGPTSWDATCSRACCMAPASPSSWRSRVGPCSGCWELLLGGGAAALGGWPGAFLARFTDAVLGIPAAGADPGERRHCAPRVGTRRWGCWSARCAGRRWPAWSVPRCCGPGAAPSPRPAGDSGRRSAPRPPSSPLACGAGAGAHLAGLRRGRRDPHREHAGLSRPRRATGHPLLG